MAQSTIATGSAAGNLKGFNRCFLSQLKSIKHRINSSPTPPAIITVHRFYIRKNRFQCIGHSLRRAMRDAELLTYLIKAYPGSLCRRQAGQPN